jgi:hypothetical protein
MYGHEILRVAQDDTELSLKFGEADESRGARSGQAKRALVEALTGAPGTPNPSAVF